MDYREIVSVTGIGGLFQLIATKSDGAIVRNLADKATKFIPARLHNVTPLESIEVYTTGENVRLHEVFEKMKAHADVALPDGKKADNSSIKSYFKSIFPAFDDERVYVSDMKKMLKWFEILKENDLLNFEKQQENSEDQTASKENIEEANGALEENTEAIEDKPVKKARSKKSANEASTIDGEEKPKKVARKKKTADEENDAEEKPTKKTAKKKSDEA